MRKVGGLISILECRVCGVSSPHMSFYGDTDMATMNLASLSSAAQEEIVILEASEAEWAEGTGEMLEERVNRELSRTDLHFVRLLRASDTKSAKGLSFQEFRESLQPRTIVYSCPNCLVGEAVAKDRLSPAEYLHRGGRLTLLGELELGKPSGGEGGSHCP